MPGSADGESLDRTPLILIAVIVIISLVFVLGSALSCIKSRNRRLAAKRRVVAEEEAWETGLEYLGPERRRLDSLPEYEAAVVR